MTGPYCYKKGAQAGGRTWDLFGLRFFSLSKAAPPTFHLRRYQLVLPELRIWPQFAHLLELPTFEVEKKEQLPAQHQSTRL